MISKEYDPTDEISDCLLGCMDEYEPEDNDNGDEDDDDYNNIEEDDDDDSDYEDGSVDTAHSSRRRSNHPTKRVKATGQGSSSAMANAPRCSTSTIDALRRMLQLKDRNLSSKKDKTISVAIPSMQNRPSLQQRETGTKTFPIKSPAVTTTHRPLTRSYLKFNGLTGKV